MCNNKLAFIDLEMTGLIPGEHEILEIGLVLVEQAVIEGKSSFKILEEFEIKTKPKHIERADPESFAINHYNDKDWEEAVPLRQALEILMEKVTGSAMVGHNVSFDSAFLGFALAGEGMKNTMHYRRLDTISIAFAKLHTHEDVKKLSLRSLCEYFGVENKKAHSALADARATYEVFLKLMAL